jgi:ubiquinone/menaquinone biosynthesis C-methylase UbiE
MNDTPKYYELTETPGTLSSNEQLRRIYQRYRFARDLSKNKKVLEIACGSGFGLTYLAQAADFVNAIDIDKKNIEFTLNNLKSSNRSHNIKVKQMDAQNLEYPDNYFDVVLLFEAIYYIPNINAALKEAERVLKKDGKFIIVTVNKEWGDFHPSPYSVNYYSMTELNHLLSKRFRLIENYGGYKVGNNEKSMFSLLKKVASKLNLIPNNLKARAYLKRIFMGKLLIIPHELNDKTIDFDEPVPINLDTKEKFKILFFVATK